MLSPRRYQNRAIEAVQAVKALIELARDMREANVRGERLRLSEDELALYDALEIYDGVVQVFGDETLRDIARHLVETGRNSVIIGRTSVRASMPTSAGWFAASSASAATRRISGRRQRRQCWNRQKDSRKGGRRLETTGATLCMSLAYSLTSHRGSAHARRCGKMATDGHARRTALRFIDGQRGTC